MHDQTVCRHTSTVTSTGSDVSVFSTTAEATDQELTPNSNLMHPLSLRDIPQRCPVRHTLLSQVENNELQQHVFSIKKVRKIENISTC